MKSRKTPETNFVFRLDGGTEDNDLHVHRGVIGDEYDAGRDVRDPTLGQPYIASVWEPSPGERAAIATGEGNVELVIVGEAQPPVSIGVTHLQPLSRPQRSGDEPRVWVELPIALAADVHSALADRLVDDPSGLSSPAEHVRAFVALLDGYIEHSTPHVDDAVDVVHADLTAGILDLTALGAGVSGSLVSDALRDYKARTNEEPRAVRVSEEGGKALDREHDRRSSSARPPAPIRTVWGHRLLRGDEALEPRDA